MMTWMEHFITICNKTKLSKLLKNNKSRRIRQTSPLRQNSRYSKTRWKANQKTKQKTTWTTVIKHQITKIKCQQEPSIRNKQFKIPKTSSIIQDSNWCEPPTSKLVFNCPFQSSGKEDQDAESHPSMKKAHSWNKIIITFSNNS